MNLLTRLRSIKGDLKGLMISRIFYNTNKISSPYLLNSSSFKTTSKQLLTMIAILFSSSQIYIIFTRVFILFYLIYFECL